ncbi:MAG TPA: hypothetical protein GXX40_00705 [Firmicutes bacterium]|nr:hypothetical protein [Bacillota bacterium]
MPEGAWSILAKVRDGLAKPLEIALSSITRQFVRSCSGRFTESELDEATQFVVEAARVLRLKVVSLLPRTGEGAKGGDAEETSALSENGSGGPEDIAAKAAPFIERGVSVLKSLIAGQRGVLARGCEPWPVELQVLPRRAVQPCLGMEEFRRVSLHMSHKLFPLVFHNDYPLWRKLFIELARKLLGSRKAITFRDFVGHYDDVRRPVAGLLLALELNRRRKIVLKQREAFGEIVICKRVQSKHGA